MGDVYIKKDELNRWIVKYYPNKDLISIDDLIGVIEDLDNEIEHLKEKIEDMEQDIKDNYKPISYKEQIGYNERDFYE